jgi:hypothetical protein
MHKQIKSYRLSTNKQTHTRPYNQGRMITRMDTREIIICQSLGFIQKIVIVDKRYYRGHKKESGREPGIFASIFLPFLS